MASEVPTRTPHDLIKKEDVEKALKSAEGASSVLKSYEIIDFTSKGDNYACVVSSVKVSYEKDGKPLTTSYVVKLNPCRPSAVMDKMVKIMFMKESGFYMEILPLFNKEFERLGEHPLRVPKHYHSVSEEHDEVIYLEDMRQYGYRMLDRKIGMGKNHTMLILKELARFHGISQVLLAKDEFQGVDIVEKFPVLKDLYEDLLAEDSETTMKDWFASSLENSAEIAEMNEGYEYVAKYLRELIPHLKTKFVDLLKPEDPFMTICHGDCWNNNFLYRYDDNGIPVECCLVDLQITRYSSPTIDLNYMLYCSLNGEVRQELLEDFFAVYYANFASILSANNQPIRFTLEQLKKDFYKRNDFGLITGMSLIPIILMDSEDAPNMDDLIDEDMEKMMADFKALVMDIVQKNPLLKSRFLCMFDEMRESGLFDSVLKDN